MCILYRNDGDWEFRELSHTVHRKNQVFNLSAKTSQVGAFYVMNA